MKAVFLFPLILAAGQGQAQELVRDMNGTPTVDWTLAEVLGVEGLKDSFGESVRIESLEVLPELPDGTEPPIPIDPWCDCGNERIVELKNHFLALPADSKRALAELFENRGFDADAAFAPSLRIRD